MAEQEHTKEISLEKRETAVKTPKKLWFFIALILFGSVAMDQWTKSVAENHLMVWESQDNISYYEGRRHPLVTWGREDNLHPEKSFYISFAFNYVRNQGAAWGLFSNLDDKVRTPLFHLITILATLLILFYWRSTPRSYHLARFSLVLIFSGALGNFADRFRRGFVVDFLDVSWSIPFPFSLDFSFGEFALKASHWAYEFPKFNWADSCITVGVTLLLIDMIFFEPKRIKASP